MSNSVAYVALFAWPIITLFLFVALPVSRAIVWSMLVGYLLLPSHITYSISGFIDFDKFNIASLSAGLFAFALAKKGDFRWPSRPLLTALMIIYVLTPLMTGVTNRDPIPLGPTVIQGVTFYTSLSYCLTNFIQIIPFIIGVGFLHDEKSHRDILRIFVICALIYSIPVLYEIRFSPSLQRRVYGITNTMFFIQSMRDGGFRAMVFLGHGLLVSTFLGMAVIAAAGLSRQRYVIYTVAAAPIAFYLGAVLILNKSAGAIMMTLLIAPAVYYMRPRRFLTVAFIIGAVVVSYPLLRSAGLIPTERALALADDIGAERSASLETRFVNEELLLSRAEEKPLFGWGNWGRNRLSVVTNWGSVSDISITDGTWIITIGSLGWIGYASLFGLLCYPFWQGFKLRKQVVPVATVSVVAMHLLNILDLIPNSSLSPMTFLVAGAVSGMTVAGLVPAGVDRRRVAYGSKMSDKNLAPV